ncbi:MAG TPA: hypothetical protein VIF64_04225 [Pyrinomonadaceae bacterium]
MFSQKAQLDRLFALRAYCGRDARGPSIRSGGIAVGTVAAAAFAAIASLQQERGGENEQTVLDVVVDSFLQFCLLLVWQISIFIRIR